VIGFAATADAAGRTRVALTGGLRVPGRAALVPFGIRRAGEKSVARLDAALREA
jgi:hypothetical protein